MKKWNYNLNICFVRCSLNILKLDGHTLLKIVVVYTLIWQISLLYFFSEMIKDSDKNILYKIKIESNMHEYQAHEQTHI